MFTATKVFAHKVIIVQLRQLHRQFVPQELSVLTTERFLCQDVLTAFKAITVQTQLLLLNVLLVQFAHKSLLQLQHQQLDNTHLPNTQLKSLAQLDPTSLLLAHHLVSLVMLAHSARLLGNLQSQHVLKVQIVVYQV